MSQYIYTNYLFQVNDKDNNNNLKKCRHDLFSGQHTAVIKEAH